MSNRNAEIQRKARALNAIYKHFGLAEGDIIRFDCTFQRSNPANFVARVDFAAAKRGGYRIITGELALVGDACHIVTASPIMGRGRVTPFRALTEPAGPSLEEIEAARRKMEAELDLRTPLDDRIV